MNKGVLVVVALASAILTPRSYGDNENSSGISVRPKLIYGYFFWNDVNEFNQELTFCYLGTPIYEGNCKASNEYKVFWNPETIDADALVDGGHFNIPGNLFDPANKTLNLVGRRYGGPARPPINEPSYQATCTYELVTYWAPFGGGTKRSVYDKYTWTAKGDSRFSAEQEAKRQAENECEENKNGYIPGGGTPECEFLSCK